jgi:hypothetical protein
MTSAVDETKHVDELRLLEAEAVHIIREVVAELERPVLLFSAGKDSIVLLRLAEKAFRPLPLPFPVMHVDTGHNFPEVIESPRFKSRSTRVGYPTQAAGRRATGRRPARCLTHWRPASSTRRSAVLAATRNAPAPKNES